MSPICSCLYRSTDTTKNYTFGLLKINLGNSFIAIVTLGLQKQLLYYLKI